MRRLPKKRNPRHSLIIEAVQDFYGKRESKSITKLSLWLMKRRKGLEPLTEEEIGDLECIQMNLSDTHSEPSKIRGKLAILVSIPEQTLT